MIADIVWDKNLWRKAKIFCAVFVQVTHHATHNRCRVATDWIICTYADHFGSNLPRLLSSCLLKMQPSHRVCPTRLASVQHWNIRTHTLRIVIKKVLAVYKNVCGMKRNCQVENVWPERREKQLWISQTKPNWFSQSFHQKIALGRVIEFL